MSGGITYEVFLNFFECGSEEDHGQGCDGSILVRGGYTGNLLNARREQKEQIGVFRELLYKNYASASVSWCTRYETEHTGKKLGKKRDHVVLARRHKV